MSSDNVVVEDVGGAMCADAYQKYQINQLLISAFEIEDGANGCGSWRSCSSP